MKASKVIAAVAAFVFTSLLSVGVLAQTGMGKSAPVDATVSKVAEMSYGEVRKIDKEAGKLTLKHGRIENLDMPAMTMVFKVKNKGMLNTLQVGDTIRFKAINDKGKLTVTDIKADK